MVWVGNKVDQILNSYSQLFMDLNQAILLSISLTTLQMPLSSSSTWRATSNWRQPLHLFPSLISRAPCVARSAPSELASVSLKPQYIPHQTGTQVRRDVRAMSQSM